VWQGAAAQEQDAAAAASSSRSSSKSNSSSSSSSRNLPGIPQWLLPLLPPPRVGKLARQAAAPTHIDRFNALFIDGCTKAAANLTLIQQLYQQPHAGYALGSLDPVELFGRAFNWAAYCYIYCYVQVLCWSHGESVAAAASVQEPAHDAAALYPHISTLYCSSRSLTHQVPHIYGFMSALTSTPGACALCSPPADILVCHVLLADLPPRQSHRLAFAHDVLHDAVLATALLPTLVLVALFAVS
jgi:hypothetical protein